MDSTLNPTQKTHIVWLDVVRLVAMFTVVCCHSADPFNFYPGEPPANIAEIKWWGAVYGSLLRPCVPLFVMITGALLLPVKGEVAPFYRKRIGRVFWPFLIWSVIYNLFPWITGLLGVAPEVILDFFPYSGEEVMRQSLDVSLGYIAQMPFNFSLLDVPCGTFICSSETSTCQTKRRKYFRNCCSASMQSKPLKTRNTC